MFQAQNGILYVTVISGHLETTIVNLKTYVQLTIGSQTFNSQVTTGISPVWQFSQVFQLNKEVVLSIKVINQTPQKEMFMGQNMINLKNIRFMKIIGGEYPIYLDNKPVGDLIIRLHYEDKDSLSVLSDASITRNSKHQETKQLKGNNSHPNLNATSKYRLSENNSPDISREIPIENHERATIQDESKEGKKPKKENKQKTEDHNAHTENISIEDSKTAQQAAKSHLPSKINISDISISKLNIKNQLNSKNNKKTYDGILALDVGYEVIIKETIFESIDELKTSQQTELKLCKLKHPSICTIITSLQNTNSQNFSNYLVREKCEGSILLDWINSRREKKEFLSEDQIYFYIKSLVSAFTYFEESHFMHGAITPKTFIVSENSIKLIKFGLLKPSYPDYFAETRSNSIHVTAPYFSPPVLQSYLKFIKTGSFHISHDIHKSDVFSLGLVFLQMATLNPPCGLNDLSTNLEDRISLIIESISYTNRIKSILKMMLSLEEDSRPDFKNLNELI
ncbi:unnamed protein product [Blepharisma stoltei]|uniref:Protein kinase domain-containing protein n=1 Tax=Blepharisma stoltei TaxID=1481888 RepID=A0AAU9JSD4_9CILI|nr:unnamed protein product [Blepharisma stoltei]